MASEPLISRDTRFGVVSAVVALLLWASMGAIVPFVSSVFPVWYVLVIPAVLGLFFLTLQAPEVGLIAILVLVYNPAVANLRLSVLVWNYVATFALIGMVFFVVVTRKVVGKARGQKPWWENTYLVTAAFVSYLCVSAMHGWLRGNSMNYVISDFAQMLELPLMYWLTVQVLRLTRKEKSVLIFALLTFVITSTWELILYLAHDATLATGVTDASLVLPISIGEELLVRNLGDIPALFLPVLIALLVLARRRLSFKARLVIATGLFTSFLNVILTFGRSVWMGQLIALMFLMWAFVRLRRFTTTAKLLSLLLVMVLLAIVLYSIPASRDIWSLPRLVTGRALYTVQQFTKGSSGFDMRLSEYRIVLDIFATSPIIGMGLGLQYIGHLASGEMGLKHWLHNTYLALLSRTGLIGILLMVCFFGTLVVGIIRRIKFVSDVRHQAIAIGVVASLLAFVVQSVSWGTLFSHPIPVYLGFGLGLAVYLCNEPVRIGRDRNPEAEGGRGGDRMSRRCCGVGDRRAIGSWR